LCAIAIACHNSEHGQQPVKPPEDEVWLPQRQAAQIKTASVTSEPIDDTLLIGGRVAFDDLKVSHVFAPVNGRITRVLAQAGDRVTAGTPLLAITSPDIGTAFADVNKAQADYTAESRDYARAKELYEAHAGSQKDLEMAEGEFKKAEAELARAKQRLQSLRATATEARNQEYLLRSPINGEVIWRNVNPGVEVQGQYGGGQAAELFTIGEVDPVFVIADVHEVDLVHVAKGRAVSLRPVAYPKREFTGTIDWVSSALDKDTRTIRIRCIIPNPEHLLKPEMYATIAVQTRGDDRLGVPRAAVVHVGTQRFVYLAAGQADDGRLRFKRRPVDVDEDVSGPIYPVKRGLQLGDDVVVDGALLLSSEAG
jgi:cobalt-zinc-cadmium efflux system membrane fusion protein